MDILEKRGRPKMWGPEKLRHSIIIRCSEEQYVMLKSVLPKNQHDRYKMLLNASKEFSRLWPRSN